MPISEIKELIPKILAYGALSRVGLRLELICNTLDLRLALNELRAENVVTTTGKYRTTKYILLTKEPS